MIPLYFSASFFGDTTKLGKGFGTLSFDEVVEFNNEMEKDKKGKDKEGKEWKEVIQEVYQTHQHFRNY